MKRKYGFRVSNAISQLIIDYNGHEVNIHVENLYNVNGIPIHVPLKGWHIDMDEFEYGGLK